MGQYLLVLNAGSVELASSILGQIKTSIPAPVGFLGLFRFLQSSSYPRIIRVRTANSSLSL